MKNMFNQQLQLEGKKIIIDNVEYRVLFRRKDTNNIMFAPKQYNIQTGSLYEYNGESHLIIEHSTNFNDVYDKFICSRCTDSFKIQFDKRVVEFPCLIDNLTDSLNSNNDGTTTNSKQEFIISLTDDSKEIKINKRFLCGYNGLAYKVIDISYINGLCYVYTIRDEISNTDDVENMIADKIDVDVPEQPEIEIGDITVIPSYTGEYFELYQYDSQTFTIALDGAAETNFSVVCDTTNAMSFSFDGENSFSCQCLSGTGEVVNISITESSTQKSMIYKIKLVSFM